MSTTLYENSSLSEKLEDKLVVADTSSLLMVGTGLLNVLKNCTLVIPSVVVKELEEKRNHSTLGFLSREWIRLLEVLRKEYDKKLGDGVIVPGYDNVCIKVEPNHSTQKSLPEHLQDGSNDSTVLAVAKNLLKDVGDKVVILSNDAPMRLHATLDIGIPSFEFNSTQIVGAEQFDGRYEIILTAEEYTNVNAPKNMNNLYDLLFTKLPEDCSENALVTVKLDTGETLHTLILMGDELEPVGHKNKAYGITGRTVEQDVAIAYLKASPDNIPVVSLGGNAGTGKTLITVAVALEELSLHKYQKVIVFRSLHEMGVGQEMGFLPGGVDDKMAAWAGAVYDALDVIAAKKKPLKKNSGTQAQNDQKEKAKQLREMIEISPITYLRGRSLANTFIILEEAQNFSRSEILNILSRAGEGSKIVLTFDAAQVDNKFLQAGKNADIWSVIDSLKNDNIFAHMTLQKTERSRVAEIASKLLES